MMGLWIVLTAAMVLLAGCSEVSREYALYLSESQQFRDASEAHLELNPDTGRGVMTLAYAGNLPPRKPIGILAQAFGSLRLGWVEGTGPEGAVFRVAAIIDEYRKDKRPFCPGPAATCCQPHAPSRS